MDGLLTGGTGTLAVRECDEGGRDEASVEPWPVTVSGSSITLHHHNTAVTSPPSPHTPHRPATTAVSQVCRGMLTPAATALETSDARLPQQYNCNNCTHFELVGMNKSWHTRQPVMHFVT